MPTSIGRRWSRSPDRRARTSSTRRPIRSSTSSACSGPSRSGIRGSSASTRSRRSCARHSAWRRSRSRARPTSSCPRTSPRWSRNRGSRTQPIPPGRIYFPEPTDGAIAHAATLIAGSSRPIILAGNGVLRRHGSEALRAFAKGLHVPVAATFMGKGAIDDRSHLSLMAVGLQARDHVLAGFDRADLVICVGYDLVEYGPAYWNPTGRSGSSISTRSRPRSTRPTGQRSSSSATST